ncbi:ectonucleotide pyrophosphatase/phosphodiesterase family member 5 [Aplysia californica]|uniref:Ectonucleotide pyrophosphatase/phosphodiesterase family member 5 n=1 Tax=Aplysia californica TaxID=6500 RepID=A0ABM0JWJ9_APLCA|nr:ectonucleotide pyrophosphatase/phosphodiesterase family member 5 [Aplysia californica]
MFIIAFFLIGATLAQQQGDTVGTEDRNRGQRRLLMISFDGFRWDYLNGRTETPNFDRFRKNGVYVTKGLINEYVSNTLPNHFSLVTGLHVESHGIVDNFMYESETDRTFIPKFFDKDSVNHPDWHKTVGEPIWVTNQLQKKTGRSGVVMWMGGEAAIKGIRPTKHIRLDYAVTDKEKVDSLISWFTDEREPINLGVAYFSEPDKTAHAYGPDSEEVTQKIQHDDDVVGYLIGELEAKELLSTTDIIITSDHGFVSVSKERLILLDDYIDSSWYRHTSFMPGSIASLLPTEGKEDIIYENLKAASEEKGSFTVYRKKDIPERFHYKNHKRVPPIIAVAKSGYSFTDSKSVDSFWLAGNHGYDNDLPEMHPFFVAMGPSFKNNFELDQFRSVDVYPLMCHILNLKPAPNNGSMETVSLLLKDYDGGKRTTFVWTFIAVAVMFFLICMFLKNKSQDKPKAS